MISTDSFVDIVQMYKQGERTVNALSKWYVEASGLQEKVDNLLSRHIAVDTISGKKVLLKPNWVRHSKADEDVFCLRTHESVILACLNWVLALKPKSVVIGDAPIQGCNWDKMVDVRFRKQVADLANAADIEVQIKDFRRVTFDPGENNPERDRISLDEFLIFDVGKKKLFRADNY